MTGEEGFRFTESLSPTGGGGIPLGHPQIANIQGGVGFPIAEPNPLFLAANTWTPLNVPRNPSIIVALAVSADPIFYRPAPLISTQSDNFASAYQSYGSRSICTIPGSGDKGSTWYFYTTGTLAGGPLRIAVIDIGSGAALSQYLSLSPGATKRANSGALSLPDNTNTAILAANINRRFALVVNDYDSTVNCRIAFGENASSTAGIMLGPGGSVVVAGDLLHPLAINGSGAGAACPIYYYEFQ